VKRSTLYSLAVVFAIAALFLLMTSASANVECRACVDYLGRNNCATAVAATDSAAHRAAQETACGPIASGMDQHIECGRIPPTTLQCRPR